MATALGTAVVPNTPFVTTPVRNLTVLGDYAFALTSEPDLAALEAEAARIVATHYGPHRENVAGANARIERQSGIGTWTPKAACGRR